LLVADDEAAERKELAKVLEREGHRVLAAACQEETLEIIEREPIHGLILNAGMEDFSGIQVLKMLRARRKAIPSILIAEEPWKELQLEALTGGAFAFLLKPVGETILKDAVSKLLDRNFAENPPTFPIQVLKSEIQIYQQPKFLVHTRRNSNGDKNQGRYRH